MLRLASIAIVGALLLSACGGPSDDQGPLRYGGQIYPGEMVLKGAPELWQQADADVKHIIFSSGTENNQALISGEIDVNCGSDSKTVALAKALGDDLVILATIQKGDRYSTVVAEGSGITGWAGLKGETVAVRKGSGAEQVLLRFFQQQDDLSWDDFTWVNLKVEDMPAALTSGTIAAFTAWEPTPAITEAREQGTVLRSYGDIASVPVSLHTTRQYLDAHRDQVIAFLRAHLAKAQLIQSDPQRAAGLAAQAAAASGSEVPSEAFLRIFKRVDFGLEVDAGVLDSIRNTATFLAEQGRIEQAPVIRHDPEPLREALATINNRQD
ncbi:MAG: ABC transporter substrate-binding protein [Planctomycetota bacterium]